MHLAEIGTTLASGLSHWRFGNVDWKVVAKVGIGSRMRMVFKDLGPGLSLPMWTLDEDAEQPEPWRYPGS